MVVEILREVVCGHFGDHLALLGLRVALGDLLVDLVLQRLCRLDQLSVVVGALDCEQDGTVAVEVGVVGSHAEFEGFELLIAVGLVESTLDCVLVDHVEARKAVFAATAVA